MINNLFQVASMIPAPDKAQMNIAEMLYNNAMYIKGKWSSWVLVNQTTKTTWRWNGDHSGVPAQFELFKNPQDIFIVSRISYDPRNYSKTALALYLIDYDQETREITQFIPANSYFVWQASYAGKKTIYPYSATLLRNLIEECPDGYIHHYGTLAKCKQYS